MLFTRDLRIHDNPALALACEEYDSVVPLFVRDPAFTRPPLGGSSARSQFLDEALVGLDEGLRRLGGALHVAVGPVAAAVAGVAAELGGADVVCARDVSPYASRREAELANERRLRLVDSHFAVAAGAVAPAGGTHYQVFSAYHRAWERTTIRPLASTPEQIRLPQAFVPRPPVAAPASGTIVGGEDEGIRRVRAFLRDGLSAYGASGHDDLSIDGTSLLSPYIRFGCVSVPALIARAREQGGDAFVRQLCWREFYAQLLWANPHSVDTDLRPRGDIWEDNPDSYAAWKAGMTGYPLVDAGMRQLLAEGWMHNRARLVTASFLVKHLGIDWREGARHFFDHLLDGDLAQNIGNWQWVAGTGVDTRPNRMFNPSAQLKKLDPNGTYVHRYVPELSHIPGNQLLNPGLLAPDYPAPIVIHEDAVAAFRARRRLEPPASRPSGDAEEHGD